MAVPEDDLPELDNMELSEADMLDESLDAADDGEQLTPAPKKKGLFGRGKAKAKKPKEKKPKKARKEKAPKAKKEKKPKKEKAPKKPKPKVKQKGGGLAASMNVYTVMLAIALLAVLVAALGMVIELQRYDWDSNADAAKRIVMTSPHDSPSILADGVLIAHASAVAPDNTIV